MEDRGLIPNIYEIEQHEIAGLLDHCRLMPMNLLFFFLFFSSLSKQSFKVHVIETENTAHKGFTITPNVNYKCPRSVAAIALPVAAMALP